MTTSTCGPRHDCHQRAAGDGGRLGDEAGEGQRLVDVGSAERRLLGRVDGLPPDVGAAQRSSTVSPNHDRSPAGRRSAAVPRSTPPAARWPWSHPPAIAGLGTRAATTRPNDAAAYALTCAARAGRSGSADPVVRTSCSAWRRASASSSPMRAAYPNRNARRQRCVAAGVDRRTAAMRAAAWRCSDSYSTVVASRSSSNPARRATVARPVRTARRARSRGPRRRHRAAPAGRARRRPVRPAPGVRRAAPGRPASCSRAASMRWWAISSAAFAAKASASLGLSVDSALASSLRTLSSTRGRDVGGHGAVRQADRRRQREVVGQARRARRSARPRRPGHGSARRVEPGGAST